VKAAKGNVIENLSPFSLEMEDCWSSDTAGVIFPHQLETALSTVKGWKKLSNYDMEGFCVKRRG
jgi:hypothetical protein